MTYDNATQEWFKNSAQRLNQAADMISQGEDSWGQEMINLGHKLYQMYDINYPLGETAEDTAFLTGTYNEAFAKRGIRRTRQYLESAREFLAKTESPEEAQRKLEEYGTFGLIREGYLHGYTAEKAKEFRLKKKRDESERTKNRLPYIPTGAMHKFENEHIDLPATLKTFVAQISPSEFRAICATYSIPVTRV